MPREKQFYFVPFTRSTRKAAEKIQPYIRITRIGTAILGKKSLTALGLCNDGLYPIRIFLDAGRRAFGFQLTEEVKSKKDGYRMLRVKTTTNSKKNNHKAVHGTFSILSIITDLDGTDLPSKRLEIKEYDDKDDYVHFGKIYYVTIPRKTDVSKLHLYNNQ